MMDTCDFSTGGGNAPSAIQWRMASWLAAMILVGAFASAGARAAEGQGGERWQYEFTPYFWASAMKGETRIGALPSVRVDLSFGDIWDALDFGLMSAFEARKSRWGLLLDGIYMKISDSATATWNGPAPLGAARTAGANVTMSQTMLAAAAAYRVSNGPTDVDIVGGARYSKIEVDVDFHASLFAATRAVSRSGSKDWVDPYVGVRVTHPVSNSWSLVGYADVGGLGVGSDSTWQAIAGVNYAFSKTVSGKLGYRVISVDYDKDGFGYDMKNQGLYAGVGIRF
jgi:opacity protein-like surface antigen